MKNSDKIIFVAPVSALSKRTRLFKICKYFYSKNITNVVHYGWERCKGEAKETGFSFNINKKIILKGGGYGGKKIRLYYLLWMIKVFFIGFKIKKNQTVWALGFESAFPLLIPSMIKNYKIIFDDADRFSMLFNFPKFITVIIEFLEKITSRNVYMHIVPVMERYNFKSKKIILLTNTPSSSEIEIAKKIYLKQKWIKAKIIIYINGWLAKDRGLDIALNIQQKMINDDIAFILCGKLDSDEAKILSNKRNVQYIGQVSNAEALSAYFVSDFVLTYYSPKNKINTLAASNKWGDGIMTNTIILVNSEVITAKKLIKNGVAQSFNYSDTDGIINFLRECIDDKQKLSQKKELLNKFKSKYLYFEDQLNEIFEL